jgi:tetratricopeptide (TPR) repeat protein
MSTPLAPERTSIVRTQYRAEILREAEAICRGTTTNQLAAEPSRLHRQGLLANRHGQRQLAQACFARATALAPHRADELSDPDDLSSQQQSGAASRRLDEGERLLRGGQAREAARVLRRVLDLEPTNVHACRLYVLALELSSGSTEAVGAWCSLGTALERALLFAEAADAFRGALARKSDCLRALVGLGSVYLQLAQPTQALIALHAALEIDPSDGRAHEQLARAYALTGRLEQAWDHLNRAVSLERHDADRFEIADWDGAPLEGCRILVWSNADLTGEILLVRFCALIRARGARVILECDGRLVPLLERTSSVDAVIAKDAPLPHVDVQVPLIALPRRFRTEATTIPHVVPYMAVDATASDDWRQRLGPPGGLSVGLVWEAAATDEDASLKSIATPALRGLAGLTGVRFISLQRGPWTSGLIEAATGLRVECPLDDASSLADAGALMQNVDLLLTVDTALAHLGGALGRPVWLMLRHAADWLWTLQGSSSPWYPTMRLFRQASPGNWDDVLARVRVDLQLAGRQRS